MICILLREKTLTLKRISSEVGCHVESADCHLAVPVSRRNLPLSFSLSLLHQQHHHTKNPHFPRLRVLITRESQSESSTSGRVSTGMSPAITNKSPTVTTSKASTAKIARKNERPRLSSSFLGGILSCGSKQDAGPVVCGVSTPTAGSCGQEPARVRKERHERQARKEENLRRKGSAFVVGPPSQDD